MTEEAPKTAYELAMEKLKAQDETDGSAAVKLSAEQLEEIAGARRDYEAKLAECKILHRSKLAVTFDPAAREELEAHYRRDLSHFESDRNKKIERIRRGDTR